VDCGWEARPAVEQLWHALGWSTVGRSNSGVAKIEAQSDDAADRGGALVGSIPQSTTTSPTVSCEREIRALRLPSPQWPYASHAPDGRRPASLAASHPCGQSGSVSKRHGGPRLHARRPRSSMPDGPALPVDRQPHVLVAPL
jgi:hypothetical protein